MCASMTRRQGIGAGRIRPCGERTERVVEKFSSSLSGGPAKGRNSAAERIWIRGVLLKRCTVESTMAIVRGLVLLALFGGVILVDGKVEKEVTELGIGVKFKPERCELKAHKGDLVSVHYRGTLADGTEFGNSYERGQPLDFKLGQGSVIKGWDQGILGMCVGEKRKLKIPAKLAYGDESIALSIPAGAALIFDTELVAVNGRTGPGPDDIVADLLGDLKPEDVEFGDPILPF